MTTTAPALPGPLDAGGLQFDALRKAGIAALQRLCGAQWTDFNVHDPGVTTLEQLVYSLTDLAYRTGFDMADYLTGPDGTIDYEALALYAPEQILPCAALTADDYRRLLYGALPELSDIWIRPAGHGLLAIDVMTGDAVKDDAVRDHATATAFAAPGAAARRVRALYAAHRVLGQDLAHVREVTPRPYYLRGEIDTCGDVDPAEVLARILFDCGEYLSSGMCARRLREVIAQGLTPEQVFDGPATANGHVTTRATAMDAGPVTVSELIGVIQKIDGVRRIRSLAIVDGDFVPCAAIVRDSASGSYPALPFPDDDAAIELLRLQPEQGIEYGVSEQVVPPAPAWRAGNRLLYDEARLELAKLVFEQRAFRTDEGHARVRFALPAGRHRALRAYYSVQHEFPAVYGIGRYGLPDSASAERKAQARQLQGFLYPLEQLMANYLQNLQDIPALFGAGNGDTRSYFDQYLDNAVLPGIGDLYDDGPLPVPERVRKALARHDDYHDRKGRVYDYLLALYGAAFPQTALRRFNQYHPADTEAWLLDAKRRLLAALVTLSAERGGGPDYTLPLDAEGAVAPLAWRASILLGFDGGERQRSLCPAWRGEPLPLAEDDDDTALTEPEQYEPAPRDWLLVPPPRPGAQAGLAPLGLIVPGMPVALFRAGAVLANYRLARDGSGYALHVQAGAAWRLLGHHGRRGDAVAAAHAAVAALAALNRECEGMHIVEHILLRPTVPRQDRMHGPHFNPAFYEARISVVLPRWTLRGSDRGFRNFAEETVREHCPAHIQPAFLWLGPGDMAYFEAAQRDWRAALRAFHNAPDDESELLAGPLHDAAAVLVNFLRSRRTEPA